MFVLKTSQRCHALENIRINLRFAVDRKSLNTIKFKIESYYNSLYLNSILHGRNWFKLM